MIRTIIRCGPPSITSTIFLIAILLRFSSWKILFVRIRIAFISGTFLFFAFPSFLVAAENYSSGGYLGARLGYSYNQNSCADMALECDREDGGYGIFTGYEFDNNFSVELSATKLGDTAAIYPDIVLKGELRTVDLSAQYSHRIYRNINIFGKLGFTYWEGEIAGWANRLKDSGERPAAAIGVQFPLFDKVDGRVEYQYFDELGNFWMGFTDASFVSFSFIWKFSAKKYSSVFPQSSTYVAHFAPPILTPDGVFVSRDAIDQHVENVLSDVMEL